VVIAGQVLGKPADNADAERMLRLLSGRTHEVLTGICVHLGRRTLVHVEPSRVRMAALNDAEIGWYVATGGADGQGRRLCRAGTGVEVY